MIPAVYTQDSADIVQVKCIGKARCKEILESLGLPKSEVDAALWICKRESSYNPKAVNKRYRCYGLYQLSWGMAKKIDWDDPVANTKRANKYVQGRYGSWKAAKRHWVKYHWY
jgi:hypothetical protein